MNINEFEDLMDRCKITMNTDGSVCFTPFSDKDTQRINQIIQNNRLENISQQDFNILIQTYAQTYRLHHQLKLQKVEQFSTLTPTQITTLSLEQKLDYLEALFPRRQTLDDLIRICRKNDKNLRICLFTMTFPNRFWDHEKKLADSYATLIAAQPQITNKLKNWNKTSLPEKKEVLKQAAEIFKHIYGTAPEIEFFTPEQEKAQQHKNRLPEDTHIYAAYYQKGKIYFNEERLQNCDNFFAVSVLFHEGTHHRQHQKRFDDPLINRIFDCNIENIAVYEDLLDNKTSENYKDLYVMLPSETHAYGIQAYMEQKLMDKTGIHKTDNTTLDKETQQIHNKAFSMAKLIQFRGR